MKNAALKLMNVCVSLIMLVAFSTACSGTKNTFEPQTSDNNLTYDDPTQEEPDVEDTQQIRNYHDMYMYGGSTGTAYAESFNFTDEGIACCICKADDGDKYYGCMINSEGKIIYKTDEVSSLTFEYAGSLSCFTIHGYTTESYVVNSNGEVVKVIENAENYYNRVDAAGYVLLIDKDSKEAKVIDSAGNEIRTISIVDKYAYCLDCGVVRDGATLINMKTGKKLDVKDYKQLKYNGSSIIAIDKNNNVLSIDPSLNNKKTIYRLENEMEALAFIDDNIYCLHYEEGDSIQNGIYTSIENIKTGEEFKLNEDGALPAVYQDKFIIRLKGSDGKYYYNLLDKDLKMIFDEPSEYEIMPFGSNYCYKKTDNNYVIVNRDMEVINDAGAVIYRTYNYGRCMVAVLNDRISFGDESFTRFYFIDENGNEIKAYD